MTSAGPPSPTWREALRGKIRPEFEREVEDFETTLILRKQGKVDEKVFAETRLRRGCYGQRYDHGERHDGEKVQRLEYPTTGTTKGPNTLWDAPGMMRIKVPFGGLSPEQLEVLADVAEEYSDEILHVTTRQDFQLHFVHIEDAPDLMRRLASVGITTREACGNSVRNVTGCPLAGICPDAAFDVTPYARAAAWYLLGHRDTQDLGRKFKISFSGCQDHACALATIHDIGAIARTREENGATRRGFQVLVGGGLGPVPYQAKVFEEFVPEEEFLPLARAICRVFARLGEKKNRSMARMKFLVRKLGMEEFKRLALEEKRTQPADPRAEELLAEARTYVEATPPLPAASTTPAPAPGFAEWRSTNITPQRQAGFSAVTIALPLGDATSAQIRALADIARRFVAGGAVLGSIRTSAEQNIVLRWIPDAALAALHAALAEIGLAEPGAGTILDITACPGTDTCKLGISSSRGLAAELRRRISEKGLAYDKTVGDLRIKVSGCPNSCGQHHIADIGFYGASRNIGGYTVPHFQVILGGEWTRNAANYGLAIGAVPSKRVPDVVDRLVTRFQGERQGAERFRDFVARIGKAQVKALLEDLVAVPSHDADASFYTDWHDPRQYSLGDIGMGECAGEVVDLIQFGLTDAEREAFEAQTLLDEGNVAEADALARRAMRTAAGALSTRYDIDVPDETDAVVSAFRARFDDPTLVSPAFASYFYQAHDPARKERIDADRAHQRVEEALLFIEACHGAYGKLLAGAGARA